MSLLQNADTSPYEQRQAGVIATTLAVGDRALSEHQIDQFAELFDLLIEKIETRVLVELAEQLATHPNVPLPVMQHLARHDETSVAAPVLTRCTRITEQDLLEIASTGRDPHLLAISKRDKVSERIVDVLVDRGSGAVRHSVVENSGARISLAAFNTLSSHAVADDELAFKVGARHDVPPYILCQLVVQAGRDVRDRLLSLARHDLHPEILRAVDRASGMVADEESLRTKYIALERRLKQRFSALNENGLKTMVITGKRDEVHVALGILSGVSVETILSLLSDHRAEPLLIIGRALEFEWSTVSGLIQLYIPRLAGRQALHIAYTEFERINPSTARTVLELWKMREASWPQ